MKTIIREDLNLYIEVEQREENRWEQVVRGYAIKNGEIVSFLGKYIVTNYTEDEIVELFHDTMVEE